MKSYIAMVEYGDSRGTHKKIFSGKAKIRSQKAIDQCDKWLAQTLREHGTDRVQCYIAEVILYIAG